MKTIRIQLHGGLGNQLFIWAAAHDLVQRNKCKVKLIYVIDKHQRADRPLEMREIEAYCTHSISVSTSKIWGIIFKAIDKVNSVLQTRNIDYVKKFGIYSLPNSYDVPNCLPSNVSMLRGYFQESSLVYRMAEDLLIEISKTLNATEIEKIYIAKQSLHIRRGDTTAIGATWGILTLDYFNRVLDTNEETVVCTDSSEIRDIYSAKKLKIVVSTDATHNSWQTLKILTRSDRFIGSNSTLSWWAAWLISWDNQKVAILPTPWRPQDKQASSALMLDKVRYEVSEFEGTGT